MKVVFDVPQFVERPLGMQVYTEHVIKEILQSSPADWRFSIQTVGWRGRHSHSERMRQVVNSHKAVSSCVPVPLRFYEKFVRMDFANIAAHLYHADIVHSFGWRTLPKTKAPVVVTIQDVIPIRLLEGDRQFIERTKAILSSLVKQAAAIITISKFSRQEIADVFGISESLIDVIPDGVDLRRYKPITPEERSGSSLEKLGVTRPYFLHKGGSTKRKNKPNLIRAFDLFKQEHKTNHQLVLAGGDSLDDESTQVLAQCTHARDVLNVGYVSAEDSVKLLQLAEALVFPSTYEGFGLPPLEAMACGVPVAMSNISSLPEVGGDAAVYFDPYKPEEIAEALRQLTWDRELRDKCIASGLERSRTMTWERNAKSTIDVYNRVCRQTVSMI
jgi:glycosyltransferase involved in cell wall biosynthesis